MGKLLDQFLAYKNMLTQAAAIKMLPESVSILRFPEMLSGGRCPQPIRYGGMGKEINPNGFSDHFPVAVTVSEDDVVD